MGQIPEDEVQLMRHTAADGCDRGAVYCRISEIQEKSEQCGKESGRRLRKFRPAVLGGRSYTFLS